MKSLIVLSALLLTSVATADTTPSATTASTEPHRYMIERTFPKGALDGLDEATTASVNKKNASVGVRWIKSFTNADKTKTFCLYEGPSEAAVREAAKLNSLPVDSVTEIPFDLKSGTESTQATNGK